MRVVKITKKDDVIGLMGYLENLKKIKCRDEKSKIKINSTLDNLDVFLTSISLIYTQLVELQTEITEATNEGDFKDKVDPVFNGISIKIKHYFNQMFSFMTHREKETFFLSECIIDLTNSLNEMYSDKEAMILEIARLKKESKEFNSIEKEEKIEPTSIEEYPSLEQPDNAELEIDEEDEEEIVIPDLNYVYQCENCQNHFKKVYHTGCTKCGGNTFKIIPVDHPHLSQGDFLQL